MLLAAACNQNTLNVPVAVEKAFHEQFPDVKNVKWELEEEDVWEAEFTDADNEKSAEFSSDGVWIESEMTIGFDELPTDLLSTLQKTHEDLSIMEAEKIWRKGGVYYEFEAMGAKKSYEILLDSNGREIEFKQVDSTYVNEDDED